MAKGKTATVFFCQNCGYESTKWLGQCPGCREWNTFVEETIDKTVLKNTGTGSRRERREASEPCVLSEIAIREENKTLTGIKELDRVLGGGIVQGSLTLVGGDPGIGKSTLLLQVCHNLSEAGHKVLYISGEESKVQIKMRADRLGTFSEHMLLLCETNLDIIGEVIRRSKPEVVIIDSIQTMYNENVSAAPGSVSQVRESTGILLQLAKGLGISIFIVGHVTKEGTVAGPRVLEHMVDTVLYFEGDRHASYRILRAFRVHERDRCFRDAGDGTRGGEEPFGIYVERTAGECQWLCGGMYYGGHQAASDRTAGAGVPQQFRNSQKTDHRYGFQPCKSPDGSAGETFRSAIIFL